MITDMRDYIMPTVELSKAEAKRAIAYSKLDSFLRSAWLQRHGMIEVPARMLGNCLAGDAPDLLVRNTLIAFRVPTMFGYLCNYLATRGYRILPVPCDRGEMVLTLECCSAPLTLTDQACNAEILRKLRGGSLECE